MANPNARLVADSKARERAAKAAWTVASLTDATFATACPYVGFLSTRPCRKRVNCQIPRPTNPFPARPRIGMRMPPLFIVVISGAHAETPARRVCARGRALSVFHRVSGRGFAVCFQLHKVHTGEVGEVSWVWKRGFRAAVLPGTVPTVPTSPRFPPQRSTREEADQNFTVTPARPAMPLRLSVASVPFLKPRL